MKAADECEAAAGARPEGAVTEADAAEGVREMFDAIAPRYDLLNHVLSVGVDRLWWSRTARGLRGVLARPEAVVLDLCCGTGDMTLALERYRPKMGGRSGNATPTYGGEAAMNGAPKRT